MDSPQISEAFALTAELATLSGASKINELPGCWEYTINEEWHIALNGHNEQMASTRCKKVPAFSIALSLLPAGMPVAFLSVTDGIFMSGSEDDFIAALKAERESLFDCGLFCGC